MNSKSSILDTSSSIILNNLIVSMKEIKKNTKSAVISNIRSKTPVIVPRRNTLEERYILKATPPKRVARKTSFSESSEEEEEEEESEEEEEEEEDEEEMY